jgi:hypothetical protein
MKTQEQIEYELAAWRERLRYHEDFYGKHKDGATQDDLMRITYDLAYAQSAVDSLEWALDIGPRKTPEPPEPAK